MRPAGRRAALLMALAGPALVGAGCAAPPAEAAFDPPPQVRAGPSQSYLAAGKRLLEVNQPALAARAFNASMSAEGVTVEAVSGAGIAAQRQGLVTQARRHFEHAVELAPNSATAHNNLGVVLYQLREYHAARTAFRAALELSRGDGETARRNLERAEATIARLDGAFGGDLGEDFDGDGAGGADALAETHRVVRLGTSEFRLIPASKTGREAPPGIGAD